MCTKETIKCKWKSFKKVIYTLKWHKPKENQKEKCPVVKMRKNLATEEQELQYRILKNQVRRLTKKGKKILKKNIAKTCKTNPNPSGNMHKPS